MAFSRSFLLSLTGWELYYRFITYNRARLLETASDRHIHARRMAIVPKAQVQQARNAPTSALSYYNILKRFDSGYFLRPDAFPFKDESHQEPEFPPIRCPLVDHRQVLVEVVNRF